MPPAWAAGEGILRTQEFSGLAWDTEDAAAPLGDVLKVRALAHASTFCHYLVVWWRW